MASLHPITPHITPSYTHKMANVFCDVNSPYVLCICPAAVGVPGATTERAIVGPSDVSDTWACVLPVYGIPDLDTMSLPCVPRNVHFLFFE